jgi:2-polyprenyl-3-methyl-5-hydroxy-6-metoxy-1,4-benzoquinol methylase
MPGLCHNQPMPTSDHPRLSDGSSRARDLVVDIDCDDNSETQQLLNELYGYKNDIITKTYHRSRIVLFHRLISHLVRNGLLRNLGAALDIGCNAGYYSKVLSDVGFRRVTGVDINAAYIAKAKTAFGSNVPDREVVFQAMDATALPCDQVYDFVLCTEVIEHTDAPNAVIASIISLLAPGGMAVISLPNCLSLGYMTEFIGALARGREIDRELRDHLKYPFYKGPRLFRRKGAQIICTAGVNCIFNNVSIRLLHRTPFFSILNRVNFWLSGRLPFKWVSQFFFFVIMVDK